ncbi:hypothetical protein CU044_2660 [Streptomyces sp. L-9-10]|nr:hypothetical protein CU044_2660 [Streptomyces sp. L-9-10]
MLRIHHAAPTLRPINAVPEAQSLALPCREDSGNPLFA